MFSNLAGLLQFSVDPKQLPISLRFILTSYKKVRQPDLVPLLQLRSIVAYAMESAVVTSENARY